MLGSLEVLLKMVTMNIHSLHGTAALTSVITGPIDRARSRERHISIFGNVGWVFPAQFKAGVDKTFCRLVLHARPPFDRAGERHMSYARICDHARGFFVI